jgi:hypothetical protein
MSNSVHLTPATLKVRIPFPLLLWTPEHLRSCCSNLWRWATRTVAVEAIEAWQIFRYVCVADGKFLAAGDVKERCDLQKILLLADHLVSAVGPRMAGMIEAGGLEEDSAFTAIHLETEIRS